MLSTSSSPAYPKFIISFAVFIKFLSIAFSSTIFIYCSAFAVVGTFSGKEARYSIPPMLSSFPLDVNSYFTVIISIGSALLYRLVIASYIAL